MVIKMGICFVLFLSAKLIFFSLLNEYAFSNTGLQISNHINIYIVLIKLNISVLIKTQINI